MAARPDDATALSELSWASFLTGDYAAAEQAGERATELAKTDDLKAMAFFNQGHAQEAQGKLCAAWTTYKYSLTYRKNAEVKARLAELGAAMLTAHPLLGPLATPEEFCRGRAGCELEHALDDDRGDGIDVRELRGSAAARRSPTSRASSASRRRSQATSPTLRGDVLTIDNNPKKIENPDRADLSRPPAGACADLPWAGKHTLAF